MSPAARNLIAFASSLLALVAAGEGCVRASQGAFAAASHRARFKAELLAGQQQVDFVTVGTSRLNDAVRPAQVGAGAGFSASIPSSSLAAQALLARAALARPDVKTLVLEVSTRQVAQLEDAALAQAGESPTGVDFESRALAHSALLRHRRVLMVENLPRLAALAWPQRFDGSEWFRTRWVLESFREGAEVTLSAPTVVCPGARPEVDAPSLAAVARWTALAQDGRAQGVAVHFVVPPVAATKVGGECSDATRALWQRTATQAGVPVITWGCASVPEALFHDGFEHLTSVGQRAFSAALGEVLRAPPACGAAP